MMSPIMALQSSVRSSTNPILLTASLDMSAFSQSSIIIFSFATYIPYSYLNTVPAISFVTGGQYHISIFPCAYS